LLKQRLYAIKGEIGIGPGDLENGIEINTVDAYQGREKDIIIISTVRTEGLGFLNDYRRMNVAITRARHFLWVVGNSRALKNNENWNAMI
jgi:senataxin